MLRPGEEEDAHVGSVFQVFRPVHREVPQGCDTSSVPIFRSGVDQENLRLLSGGHASPEAVALSGHRVGSSLVANRKLGLRERSQLIWLREALVETAQTGAAGLDKQRVDGLPTLLIGG